MRSTLDDNVARGLQIATALRYGVSLLTITGDQTLADGMPMALGFDPTNTGRNITLYTPTVVNAGIVYHKLFHFGTGTGQLTIKSPAAAILAVMDPGSSADCFYINGAWQIFIDLGNAVTNNANKVIIPLYTTLIGLVNTQVLAVTIPWNFTLTSLGFRVRTPVTTGAKLATLTAQVNGTPVTGGVLSLTSAAATPTNTLVAGTAITALNTGTAGQNVGALVSAVTAFAEGDGYVEFGLTRNAAP
jgi:hypothetical protein